MSSTTPLNSHPQDAVPGHGTRTGIGGVQPAAGVRHGQHHDIDHGYVPVRQLYGKVVGVWGDAHIRLLNGDVVPLHVGDVVRKGEVVLTAQDGIIQIEASRTLLAHSGKGAEVDRIISQVDNGEIDVQPAAGPNGGGANGSLEEGLRVGRDAESVSPAALDFDPLAAPTQPTERAAVAPLASASVANPDTETTAANTPVVFDPRTNDSSGSPLHVVAIAGQPISAGNPVTLPQGTVTLNPDGTLTFTPTHNFNGSITFTYTDADTSGSSSTSTVTVDVGNQDNHVPIAVADTFSGIEDTPISGSLTANDTPSPDGGNVWSLAAGAAHGTVTVDADGTFSYVPAAHYSGPDSFAYTITDAEGDTSTTTVTLNLAPVPLAVADAITVAENSAATGSLAGNDTASPDGTSVWTRSTDAAHGTVVVHPDGTYTYTPNAGFHGTDTFTYTITDAAGSSSTATVTLSVMPATPVAAPDVVAAHENTPVSGSLGGNDTPVAGETNTWTVTGQPSHGGVTVNTDGTYTYTPAPGFTGTDTFTYTITDGSGQSSTASVTLSVAPIAPVAVDDSVDVVENAPATGSLAGNDSPVAGETNSWAVTGQPLHGVVTVGTDGTYTYTPTPGFTGTDTFTYSITDTSGQTSTATVTLTVAPAAPVAAPDTFTVDENSPSGTLSVATNDSPVAGEANTWSVASSPAHGTLTPDADFATSGNFTYVPDAGYSGPDTFSYTITDASGQSSTASVTLNVAPINPGAAPDTFAATENGTTPTLSVATNDTPIAGETNTWSVASNATAHGSITPAADFASTGNFTYTPTPGFSGTDTFTYSVTDGSGHASPATVTINVAAIDPAATPDTFGAVENGTTPTLSVATNDTPVAGETNTWSVASNATAHGTITPAADFASTGNFTYTPTPGFSGTDTLTYTVTDGAGHASTATVTLNIEPINPGAASDTFAATENGTTPTLSVATNDSPVAGEANTWSVASTTTPHGTITPAADFATTGNFTYTPTAGYVGSDSFAYTITDGSGHVSTATVTLNVAPIAPIAIADAFTATENSTTATFSVKGNDTPVAGETNTWSLASNNTAHGSITPAADFATTGNFTYTPAAGFSGTDTFTYTVTDADGQSSTATVTISVAPINPVAVADTFNATENATSGMLSVKTNDTPVAGETNTWSVASNATAHGTIAPAADFASTGNFSYTPSVGYSGPDSFTYTVTDGSGHASTATVTINVAPINPTAVADNFNATENSTSGTLSVKTNDSGVAGETNAWSISSTSTAHGSITPAADFASTGDFTYTPSVGFSGTDTFTYTVTDSSGHASTATVTISVAPINPTAVADTFTATENGTTPTLSVATNDVGVAGETSTWSVASNNTAHGSITPAPDFATTGNFTYTPTAGYSGPDTFTYTITDNSGHASTATVTINVAPIDPTAAPDTFNATENGTTGTLSVATNDTPVAGEASTWSVASTTTAHGTITPAADFATTGNFTYTPTTGYVGPDTFTYTLTDGSGHASTATVTINVAPIDPTAAPDTFSANENTPTGTLSVATNDSPVAGETNTWSVASTSTAHGSITPAADFASTGNFTYTPDSGYVGPDTFTYTITDGSGHASTATVTINVAAIDPGATPDAFGVPENTPSSAFSVATNDAPVAGETNTWSVASTTTAHGTITPAADFATTGNFTYTPNSGYVGTDTFSYTITDASGHSSTATVTLSVAPIAPTAVDDTFSANENGTTPTLSIKGNDSAVAGETNTWSVASTTTVHGTITPAADFASTGNFTYTPDAGYIGADSFTYTITDAHGQASSATVTINVAPIDPTAAPDTFNATENGTTGTLSVATNDTPVAGETNTWSVASTTTAHGTITPAADFASTGNFVYTPTTGFSGTDTFTYTVTDGSGHASTATVTLNVAPIDPVAVADTFNATENSTSGTLSVATNDTRVAGETNSWAVTTSPTHGTITPAADFASTGNFTYTPNGGYSGPDSFTYTVTDGTGHASTATVTLNVAPINPIAVPDTFSANENTSTATFSVKANDTPVAGETNTWSVASTTTAHGVITPAADFATSGNFIYRPNAGYSGPDTFTYTITDGSGHSSSATVTINVAPINPTASPDTFAATENSTTGTFSVKTNDTPVTGETNRWAVTTNPSHGTITPAVDFATTGNFTYTPTLGYSGPDTFTYTVTDGSGHASTATVTLNVAPINPVAVADTFNATENATSGTLSVKTNDTGVAGESNTWSVATTTTAHGSIALAADFATTGNFTYTANSGYSGPDSFTYRITDGSNHSSTATVAINVAPINPTAAADTFNATENSTTGTLSVKTNDTPVAGESNTWAVATSPAHGTITPAADFATTGNFTYTPTSGYSGPDTFTYTITDGSGHASTATVTLNVAPINPTAIADTFGATENSTTGTLSVKTNDSAVAGETNTWSVASTTTAHGTITPAADFASTGNFTYTPTAGYSGPDSFSYTITDGSGHASTATVTLNVAPINPTAVADTFNASENIATGLLSVKTNDTPVAGETNSWSIPTTTTSHGTITPAADFASTGNFTYKAIDGYIGTDTFTYTITDGSGHSSTATVTLNIAPINPTAVSDTFNVVENTATATLSVSTNDAPVAGETNTWSVASTTTTHGTITPAADFASSGKFVYTPNAGYVGTDTFTYTITDGSGHASTATVTLNVAPVAPVAVADAFNATENSTTGTLSVKTNDTPVTGETNTWTVASTTTAHGTITPAADFASTGNFTYTPTVGYSGTDTFTYTITDTDGQASTATVTITVAPINPVAVADTFNATENATTGTLTVKSNDTPVAGETNTWSVASTKTTHGSITPAANFGTTGNFTYTPTAGYSGPDTFTYTVTDGSGQASTATVTINIAPINPTAVADTFNATENSTSGTLSVKTNDTPVAGETNAWSVASTTTPHGTITPAADFASTGNFTYTPTAGYSGPDTFTYTITDGSGHASTATVTLNVAPINPTAIADAFNATENSTTGTLSVKTNDTPVAGETNTWSVASTTTAHGTITPAADFASTGNFTYTPTAGYIGTDTFTYTITDGSNHASTATVTITVAPINPVAVADTFNATENSTSGTLSVKTNDTPVAGETNTWSVASTTTAHGVLTPAADFATTGNFTYTPNSGYSGPDTFTYTITDGSNHASTATVTINVAPINPTAAADTFNASENSTTGTLSVKTNDTPVAGEGNTWAVTTSPAHGTITPAADFATTGNFTYTPTSGYSGPDSFTYTITDTSGHSSTATVTLTVAPINPIAVADTFNATENSTTGTLSVKTNDTAVAGEGNTWSVASNTTPHGVITPAVDFASTGNFTYTPTSGYSGPDTFSYTITDTSGHASTATVTITVAPINPVAVADTFNATENSTTGTLSVKTNDTPVAGEGNTWSVASTTTAHGVITPAANFGSTGNFTYTPTSGYSGPDSFTYTILDSSGHSSTATVTINVAPINPTAVADAFNATENSTTGTLSVKTNDTGVTGEANTWSVTTNPTHGTITPAADFATTGNFTYTPTAGYSGPDSFTYAITDGSGHASTATVTLTVAPIDPVAVADSFNVNESTTSATLSVKTNDTPVAGETNTWSVASNTTTHGTITPAADFATTGNFKYTPTAGYIGNDTFTYTITDSSGHASTATVTLVVAAINPGAVNDTFTTNEDTAVAGTVITNDTPVAGETNTWSVTANPTHGTLVLAADFASSGKFTYTPTANYSGTDTFTYKITDTTGHTSTATATITITPVADAPTLTTTDKTYYAATNFEEPTLPGNYGDVLVSTLGSGSGSTTAAHAGTWQTDNGGASVEVGTGGTYGIKNADGTTDTSHVIELEQNLNDASNLYTTMTTKAGEVYTLNFDYAARGGSEATSIIYVYWEGQLVDTLNTQTATLQHTTLQLISSTNGTGKLEFVAGDSSSFGGVLDNVTLGLSTNTGVQGYAVNLPVIASALVDADGSETFKTTIDTIPVGATLTDGTHSFTATAGATTVDVSSWTLDSLAMTSPTAGDFTLGVHATSTETANGATATTNATVTVHVLDDTAGVYGTTGNDTLTVTDASASASSIRWGLDGNDSITGSIGHDTLLGGAGNDTLRAGSGTTLLDGGTGNDSIVAGAGSDTVVGGQGNDTMTAGTGAVTDVFKWHLNDGGSEGSVPGHAAVDTIINFDAGKASAGGDILDLRDLLVGELANKPAQVSGLTHFLDFDTTTTAGSTIIHISSHGDFASGYAANNEDQTIILQGVDLRSSMGLAANSTDAQVITELLNRGKLITDGL